jgi:hypothetical protein
MINYLEQWVNFYQTEFPTRSVPPMPKSSNDLNITEKLALENFDQGRLFQNLFGNSGLGVGLPGDVQLRLQKNELLPQDAAALRAANLPHYAQQCEDLGEAIEKAARVKAWSEMDSMSRLAANPPSDAAVAQARAAWGITGQPTYE